MDEDVPDGSDVAVLDVDGAEQERNSEREDVEFEQKQGDEEPGPGGGDAVDESEDDDDDEIDEDVDDGGKGSRDDNDVLRKTDFAEEVATVDDGLDALVSALSEETPESGTD